MTIEKGQTYKGLDVTFEILNVGDKTAHVRCSDGSETCVTLAFIELWTLIEPPVFDGVSELVEYEDNLGVRYAVKGGQYDRQIRGRWHTGRTVKVRQVDE